MVKMRVVRIRTIIIIIRTVVVKGRKRIMTIHYPLRIQAYSAIQVLILIKALAVMVLAQDPMPQGLPRAEAVTVVVEGRAELETKIDLEESKYHLLEPDCSDRDAERKNYGKGKGKGHSYTY